MVTVVQNVAKTRRIQRRPVHGFHVIQRPWQIQPIVIAPVLAGESMVSMRWQARTVSKPVKNSLIGWWHETMFFYVKLTDLERGSMDEGVITQMLTDPNYDLVTAMGGAAAAKVSNYHHAGTIDWAAHCLECVVDHYFREEGESATASGFHLDNVQIASTGTEGSWLDSMTDEAAVLADDVIVPTTAGVGADDVSMAAIVEAHKRWLLARQQNMTKMTYEEYLRTFGVSVPSSDIGKPELIRYNRSWSYPTNTVEATTGVPSAALSFSIQERADKKRLFREPGFVFGVQILRPKVYRTNQSGSLVDSLTSAIRWLPATLMGMDEASQVTIDNAASGPLTGQTNDYRIDLKDLFLYGDQFVNHALNAGSFSDVTLPDANSNRRYADSTDANNLFSAAAPANTIETDGICQLQILGHQVDSTP